MKKFEAVLTVVVVIYLVVMTIGMFAGDFSRRNDRKTELKSLRDEVERQYYQQHINDVLFGKYADSIPDEMLKDFYPQDTDLNLLRYRLKDIYESHMVAEEDGLI